MKKDKVHCIKRDNRSKVWCKNERYHRDNDLPAIIEDDGTKVWYQNGKAHRDGDKPAMECADGSKFWYKNGKLHRDNDLPAIINANGTKFWCINDIIQPNKIAKCCWIEKDQKQFKWFESEQDACKHMKMILKKEICSWVEKG